MKHKNVVRRKAKRVGIINHPVFADSFLATAARGTITVTIKDCNAKATLSPVHTNHSLSLNRLPLETQIPHAVLRDAEFGHAASGVAAEDDGADVAAEGARV